MKLTEKTMVCHPICATSTQELLPRDISFYIEWAERAASLLTFRDCFVNFDEIAQELVVEWEKYPPHAKGIKEMGDASE